MIPEWLTNGDLPPGVHFATWRELEDRLSFNPRRHRMLAGFRFVDFFRVNKTTGEPKGILAIRLGRSGRK